VEYPEAMEPAKTGCRQILLEQLLAPDGELMPPPPHLSGRVFLSGPVDNRDRINASASIALCSAHETSVGMTFCCARQSRLALYEGNRIETGGMSAKRA
jgi:hypothetical protein